MDLDELWERVDDAADLSSDERRKAIETLDHDLSALATVEDALYLRAYALYLHPDRVGSESVAERFHDAVSAVLALVPDHALALMYRAHDLYDRQAYKDALVGFEMVPVAGLALYMQLKRDEMLLCCALRLRLPDVPARMIAFAERSSSHDIADLHPVNLLAALRASPELGAFRAELAELDSALRLSWFSSLLES